MNPSGGFRLLGVSPDAGFSGQPKVKQPRLPLRAKLSMASKLKSFIGKGAFGKSSTGSSGKMPKEPNFSKNL